VGGLCALQNILQVIFNLLLFIGVILAVSFLAYGGLKWITSEGEKEKSAQAKNIIIYSIIGLIIIILAFSFVKIIGQLLGVSLLPGTTPCP